jgi:carboxyl-terminal processing protease
MLLRKLLKNINQSCSIKFIVTSLPYEIEQMVKDNVLKEKRDRWHEGAKDIYVEEALNVLDDLQAVVKKTMTTTIKRQAGKILS